MQVNLLSMELLVDDKVSKSKRWPATQVCFEVFDSGIGISEEHIETYLDLSCRRMKAPREVWWLGSWIDYLKAIDRANGRDAERD
ncbi:hypothetical protein OK016_02115 [Vibrio chagasii]|nr:hypothetical protein [Vibrio chagasii]